MDSIEKSKLKYIGKKFGKLLVLEFAGLIPMHNPNSKTKSEGTFKVRCDCGAEKIIPTERLRGGTKSCGCSANNKCGISPNRKLELGIGAFNNIFNYYRSNARKRNLEFTIPREEFMRLTLLNCTYCDAAPANKKESKHYYGAFVYNGIDRIDNTKGYILGNCTPCCKMCNIMKNIFSEKEFKEKITKLYNFYVQKH